MMKNKSLTTREKNFKTMSGKVITLADVRNYKKELRKKLGSFAFAADF